MGYILDWSSSTIELYPWPFWFICRIPYRELSSKFMAKYFNKLMTENLIWCYYPTLIRVYRYRKAGSQMQYFSKPGDTFAVLPNRRNPTACPARSRLGNRPNPGKRRRDTSRHGNARPGEARQGDTQTRRRPLVLENTTYDRMTYVISGNYCCLQSY